DRNSEAIRKNPHYINFIKDFFSRQVSNHPLKLTISSVPQSATCKAYSMT
ncbi:2383_t:CDS:1, partial [Funneliformis mosseae]